MKTSATYVRLLMIQAFDDLLPENAAISPSNMVRILFLTDADCMLQLSGHLYALNRRSIAVIPAKEEAHFLYGKKAQYYVLQFAAADMDPLDMRAQVIRLCSNLPHLRLDPATFENTLIDLRRLTDLVCLGQGDGKAAYARLYDLLVLLVAHGLTAVRQAAQANGTASGLALDVKAYLDLNFTEPITLQNLCQRFYVSPSHLCRVFKKQVGRTLVTYLNDQRIARAVALLQEGKSCAQARDEAGYIGNQHFITQFRRRVGLTPGQYRIQYQRHMSE